jgi:hypothetical protein
MKKAFVFSGHLRRMTPNESSTIHEKTSWTAH